jgi:hypothetical protein
MLSNLFNRIMFRNEERRDRLRYARSSIVWHSGFEAAVGDWYRGPKPLHGNYWPPLFGLLVG